MIRLFTTILVMLTLWVGGFPFSCIAQDIRWTEESFADFRNGTFSASGVDVYVTRQGVIKTINRYDLNNNGYLDLVFNSGHDIIDAVPPTLYSHPGDRQEGIFQQLPVDGSKQVSVADLNNNGYNDAVFLPNNNGVSPRRYLSILWGDERGWTNRRKTQLTTISPITFDIADVNGNSWPNSLFYDFGTYIFWGGPEGFDPTRAQKLTGHGTVGITIADWDRDGYPDIFLPSYKYAETREAVAAHLYWGSPDGFSDSLRTDFLQNAGNGAMAGDFNGDGNLDLAVSNHTKDGNHYTHSQVFYNQDRWFRDTIEQRLPTVGSQLRVSADIGSQYDRSFQKYYTSSVFVWAGSYREGAITVSAHRPGKTQLQVSVRTAGSPEVLEETPWQPLGPQPSHTFAVSPTDSYLQYRLRFSSDNGDRYPEVDKVEVSVSSD